MSWEIVYPIGAAALFGGIAFAAWRTSRRTPREKAVTELAAKEMKKPPEDRNERKLDALEAEAEMAKRESD